MITGQLTQVLIVPERSRTTCLQPISKELDCTTRFDYQHKF